MSPPFVSIPDDFAAWVVQREGEAGRDWLEHLPALIETLCAEWNLILDEGKLLHGGLGIVVPVRRGDEPAMLKIGWLDESTAHEAQALAAWNGRGAVQLLAAQPEQGALLLERLDSTRPLATAEPDEALAVAGRLLRRLAIEVGDDPSPSPPPPRGEGAQVAAAQRPFPLSPWGRGRGGGVIPHLKDVAERLTRTIPERWERLGRPLPKHAVEQAVEIAGQLGGAAGNLLANYDLHYDNILAARREPWLAIDPKVVVGDPEFALAQLVWRRLADSRHPVGLQRTFDALVYHAELDPLRARRWTLVRCVDYWLWGLSVGLTEDPVRCQAIIGVVGVGC
jgi:streptomycin 6-kinase